jgi:hypothetical protein
MPVIPLGDLDDFKERNGRTEIAASGETAPEVVAAAANDTSSVSVRLNRQLGGRAVFPVQTGALTHFFHSAAYSRTKPTARKRNMTDTSFGQSCLIARALVDDPCGAR